MGDNQEIAKAAGVIGGATFLSRLLGYLRDVIVANLFGAGLATDAFIVANRIPNYLRRLFGEGTLNASLVPVFSEYLNRRSRKEAWELANVVMTTLSALVTFLTLLGIFFAPIVVRGLAPGFSDNPEQFELAVLLTRVTFPFAIFVGLSAAVMGVLNTLKHFGAPALAPAILNVTMILCALFLSPHLSVPILSLSIGVLLGGLLQFLVQVPFLRRRGFRFRFRFSLRHRGFRRVVRLMVPGAIGQSVLQINIFVGNILASFLPTGSISFLFFADRLVQFPLGVFGISAATAMLPTLSQHAAEGDLSGMVETLARTMRLVLFLMVPSLVGLAVLSVPIVSALFQRGNFGYPATVATAQALYYYALGLWAFAEVRVVAQIYYAMQDTWTPMKIGAVTVLANIVLSLLLMGPLKHGGLALANSISSMLNIAALVWFLRRRVGPIQGKAFLRLLLKILPASAVMGFCAHYGAGTELWELHGHTMAKFCKLSWGILLGAGAYIVMCMMLRVQEVWIVRDWLFRRSAVPSR